MSSFARLTAALTVIISLFIWGCNSAEETVTTVTYTDNEGNAIELISDKNLTIKTENNLAKAYTPDQELFTGEQKLYHQNKGEKGALRNVRTFEKGLLLHAESYDDEGNISERIENEYENSELAVSTYFYPNGGKKSELVYASSNGERTGSVKEWHDNGQLKFEMPLDSLNRYDGEMVLYDKQGDVVKKEIYQAGELVES